MSKQAQDYPLHYKMRLVPTRYAITGDEHGIAKWERCRATQAHFYSNLKWRNNWDIVSLDFRLHFGPQEDANFTLRDFIMRLWVPGTSTRLFVSVDKHFKGNGHVYYFLPQHEAAARAAISAMLPLLRHHTPDSLPFEKLEKFFTPQAVQRSKTFTWNEERKTMISAEDKMLDELDAFESDDDLEIASSELQIMDLATLMENTNKTKAKSKDGPAASDLAKVADITGAVPGGSDADSVSTFKTSNTDSKAAARKKRGGKPPAPNLQKNTADEAEEDSSSSSESSSDDDDSLNSKTSKVLVTKITAIEEAVKQLGGLLLPDSGSKDDGNDDDDDDDDGDDDEEASTSTDNRIAKTAKLLANIQTKLEKDKKTAKAKKDKKSKDARGRSKASGPG